MRRLLTYINDREGDGLRIEQYLRRKGYSRKCLAHLKEERYRCLVNGEPRYLNQKFSEGDRLEVLFEEDKRSEKIVPIDLPLDIVYEDEDIVVVNKPAGMPTHPSMKNYENTLANALAKYYEDQGEDFVFRCTNRLDRDTSGLTVIAKNMLSSAILSEMAVKKQVLREYRAIVRGRVEPPEGTIDVPLGRKAGSIIERCVDFEHGETAVTHYRLLDVAQGHSLVELRLETGRTHQIRIHMKYLGYPLIGDYLYNPDMEWMTRQALHSYKLEFLHPVTKKLLTFVTPLPADMLQIFVNNCYKTE